MITQQQVLNAVRRLPQHQQRQLAEQIMQETAKSPPMTLVALKSFPSQNQHRLDALADKNVEGRLTRAERAELRRLVDEAQRLSVENARALVRAQRPALFDTNGHPIKRRVQQAVRAKARAERATRNKQISNRDE